MLGTSHTKAMLNCARGDAVVPQVKLETRIHIEMFAISNMFLATALASFHLRHKMLRIKYRRVLNTHSL